MGLSQSEAGLGEVLCSPLRVKVPNNHILTPNLYYNYYYPKPKYLLLGTWTLWGPSFWVPLVKGRPQIFQSPRDAGRGFRGKGSRFRDVAHAASQLARFNS